jgi:parvulin-like peptidyl-prolyl isomerase
MVVSLQQLSSDSVRLLARHNMLRGLVQREVIAKAITNASISEEELQSARSHFRQQHRLTEQPALSKFLAEHGLSSSDFDWQALLPLRLKKHCLEHYSLKAEARFLRRKSQLDRVTYSLLRVKDGFLARELYLRIASAEANFADLAAQYAEGPERSTNGIIGPVSLTQPHPAVAEKLRTCSAKILLEPFKVEDWWLILRPESFLAASFDEEMRVRMASEIFSEWVEEETSQEVAKLVGSVGAFASSQPA